MRNQDKSSPANLGREYLQRSKKLPSLAAGIWLQCVVEWHYLMCFAVFMWLSGSGGFWFLGMF